jgi:hypothetical protein
MSAFSDGNRHSNFSKTVDLVRDHVLTTLGRLSPSSWDSPNLVRLSCGLYVLAPRHLPALLVPFPHPFNGGPPPILDSILVFLTNDVRHKLSCVDVELQAQRAVAASSADYASAQSTAHPNLGMFNLGLQPPRRNLRRRSPALNRVPSTSATTSSLREPPSPSSPSQISPLFSNTDAPPPSDGTSGAEPRSAPSPRRREAGQPTPGLTTKSGRPGTSSPPLSPLSAAVDSPLPPRRSLSPPRSSRTNRPPSPPPRSSPGRPATSSPPDSPPLPADHPALSWRGQSPPPTSLWMTQPALPLHPPSPTSNLDPSRPCQSEWPCGAYLLPRGLISGPDLCIACAGRIHRLRGRILRLRFPSPPPTPPLPPAAALRPAAPRLSRRLAGLAPPPPSSSAAPAPQGRRRRPRAAP